jgi:hypothetical protein
MAQTHYKWQANTGIPVNEHYNLEVSSGYMQGAQSVAIPGHSHEITTTERTLWDLPIDYVFPPAATIMTVSSTSADDTLGGTGAVAIAIVGLDADYNEFTEIVVLNGLTPVSTTQEFFRINRSVVVSSGTGKANAGAIHIGVGTVTAGVPVTTYLYITVGDSISRQSIYTVPAGMTLYTNSITATAESSKNVTLAIIVYPEAQGFTRLRVSEWVLVNNFSVSPEYLVAVAAKTDLETRASVKAGTTTLNTISYNICRVDNV